MLTVITARGGSKGLPGKNIRLLAGHPLIAHSILCALQCSEIDRMIVSSDDPEIIEVAKTYGADTPFVRPAELAADETSMMAVLQHALVQMEKIDAKRYESVLLLDPTSPGRYPEDISQAIRTLEQSSQVDGIIGVSEPEFNPFWHSVVEQDGIMKPLFECANEYVCRQDVPKTFRINAALYIWRRDFLLRVEKNWLNGSFLMHEIPEFRAIHIDDIHEFNKAEALIISGLLHFPWINNK